MTGANAKIKRIYVGDKKVRPDPIPGYQQVQYIQSSGTQYINTGYIPSNNTKIEMSMGGFSSSTSSNSLFGARYSWNTMLQLEDDSDGL